ncbi:non-specific lipid-transfer protein 1-like [Wolffia australiana]
MARKAGLELLAGVLVFLVLAAPSTAITCQEVTSSVLGCIPYIRTGGAVAPPFACCDGIRGLNSKAVTTIDRQTTCRCLKNLANLMGRSMNPGVISGLPSACGVRVPYPINPNTNCDRIR